VFAPLGASISTGVVRNAPPPRILADRAERKYDGVPPCRAAEVGVRKSAWVAVWVAVLLTLSACGQPVPPEKSTYVGEWHAPGMGLLITQDGSVVYKRIKGGVTTSINGPLRRFDGDDFIVGLPYLTTRFEVSKPPFQDGGKWKMVVDGVELTRVE